MHKDIVVMSDTHSYLDPGMKEYISTADEIWHAGDIGNITTLDLLKSWNPNIHAVYGNIDGHEVRTECEEYKLLRYGKHTILMIHIAGTLGKYNQKTRMLIKEHRPTILICGHSHILKVKKDTTFGLLYMNPGACGHHGFHLVRTLLKFQLHPEKLSDLNVIELGRRGRE